MKDLPILGVAVSSGDMMIAFEFLTQGGYSSTSKRVGVSNVGVVDRKEVPRLAGPAREPNWHT